MDFKNKIMEPESKQFIRHETKNKNPDKWGWYDTDKGSLFWYEMENIWSCNQDRVSAEYPRYWYEEVALSSPLKSSIDVKIVEQIKRDLIFLYKNREFNELEQYVLNLIPTEGMKLWDDKGMTKIAEAVHQWMSSDDGGPFATLDELVAAHLLGIPPFLIHKDSKEKLYRNKRCDGCVAEPKDKICDGCLGVNGEFEEVIFHKDKGENNEGLKKAIDWCIKNAFNIEGQDGVKYLAIDFEELRKNFDEWLSSTPLDKEGYEKKEVSLIEELRNELYGLMDFCIDGGHIDLDDDSIERVKTYKEVMNKAGKFLANPPLQKDKEEMSDQEIEKLARAYVKTLPALNYRSIYDFGTQNITAFSEGMKAYRDRLKNK